MISSGKRDYHEGPSVGYNRADRRRMAREGQVKPGQELPKATQSSIPAPPRSSKPVTVGGITVLVSPNFDDTEGSEDMRDLQEFILGGAYTAIRGVPVEDALEVVPLDTGGFSPIGNVPVAEVKLT